jgi:pimeloyl-ACP methyl ester carboxylesterase
MTLLLLHGVLGRRTQLDALDALVSHRRPVLQVEFEGHGTTPARARPFSVEGFVENVVAALDSAGLEKVDVFGYSIGGYVGLALALAHPSRVSTITTLGTRFDWKADSAKREAALLQERGRALIDRLEGMERVGGDVIIDGTVARTAALLASLGEHAPLDASALACIHHRVRIMVGDRDASVSVEESAAAFRRLPSGELMVLPRTPHPIEQVDVYRLADVLIELTS